MTLKQQQALRAARRRNLGDGPFTERGGFLMVAAILDLVIWAYVLILLVH